MIHMHSMLSSETNASTTKSSGAPLGHAALDQATLDSFHGALSDAVSSTLEKFGIHPKDVNISITPANADPTAPASSSPDAPTRTAPPTPGTAPSTSESSSSSSNSTTSGAPNASGAPNGGYDPFLQAAYNNPYQNAPAQTSTKPSAETTPAPLDAQQIFDNNYWAQQPPAVQPLRTMQNQEQRSALATQLASEGYSIDVPIMVWGWDPSTVTSMRQAEGYTWVPSALQAPVDVAPGLPSMGTLSSYNSKTPPAGSIAV
jgi:hypothetical protein